MDTGTGVAIGGLVISFLGLFFTYKNMTKAMETERTNQAVKFAILEGKVNYLTEFKELLHSLKTTIEALTVNTAVQANKIDHLEDSVDELSAEFKKIREGYDN